MATDRARAPRTPTRVQTMEGRAARLYARVRQSEAQQASFREQAARFVADLPEGAEILEVAPGPGYLAAEMARSGRVRVTGLDVSHTMLEIAAGTARAVGVSVTLRHGDVRAMPFADMSFERIVCQAAFKSFPEPLRALDEMHRVLRPGGQAIIQDMRGDATGRAIAREAATAGHGLARLWVRLALTGLRRQALTPAQFDALARRSAFGPGVITQNALGLEVRLTRA